MIESVKPKVKFSYFILTIILGVVTWYIQHSCHPMIGTLDMSMCKPDLCISPPDCITQPIHIDDG
jgi:hypothetical protein